MSHENKTREEYESDVPRRENNSEGEDKFEKGALHNEEKGD